MSELKRCPFCGKEVKIEAESKMDVWEEVNKLIEKEKLIAVIENLEERKRLDDDR